MNTTLQSATIERAPSTVTAPRVVSIDIFRGLTMMVMIFVNELSSAHGMPWWTEHAPANVDVMTYVDMVYPFFLFIVGMSMPLSVAQRLKRDPSMVALWRHILVRVGALITLGLILANAEKADAARMGISGGVWALVGLVSAALSLNVYGKSERYAGLFRVLRVIGFGGVAAMFALFRRGTAGGHFAWIDGSYPEILGLIGYTYLAVAILYIPTRRWKSAPMLWFALLLAFCAASTLKWVALPGKAPLYFWPFDNGAMASIVMAGVFTSSLFVGRDRRSTPRGAMTWAAGFALLSLVAGWLLTPLGISKIRATPTWALYSVGAATLIFCLLYWVCDVKQWQRWAVWLRPAGSNTLLTYLLPDLWYFLMVALGVTYFDTHWNTGPVAVVKTLIFTFTMLGIAGALTRVKVRLQL
jgi:heparan-alpha-glucosaminide N-acetyltransferase